MLNVVNYAPFRLAVTIISLFPKLVACARSSVLNVLCRIDAGANGRMGVDMVIILVLRGCLVRMQVLINRRASLVELGVRYNLRKEL